MMDVSAPIGVYGRIPSLHLASIDLARPAQRPTARLANQADVNKEFTGQIKLPGPCVAAIARIENAIAGYGPPNRRVEESRTGYEIAFGCGLDHPGFASICC